MTFDPTKPVQTRDGRKVELITTKGREPWVLVGYIDDGTQVVEWLKDGSRMQSHDIGIDLINVPEPAKVVNRYLNVYKYGMSTTHESRQRADEHTGENRLACIHIRWTEGKGAEIIND